MAASAMKDNTDVQLRVDGRRLADGHAARAGDEVHQPWQEDGACLSGTIQYPIVAVLSCHGFGDRSGRSGQEKRKGNEGLAAKLYRRCGRLSEKAPRLDLYPLDKNRKAYSTRVHERIICSVCIYISVCDFSCSTDCTLLCFETAPIGPFLFYFTFQVTLTLMSRTNPKIASHEKWQLSFLLGIEFSWTANCIISGSVLKLNLPYFFLPYFFFQTEQIRFRTQSEQFNWLWSDQTNTRRKHHTTVSHAVFT